MSVRCKNCGFDHLNTGCGHYEPYFDYEDGDDRTAPPFLMVVTEVDNELQMVSLSSVHDGEPPATMQWHYGLSLSDTTSLDDKVGACYRVTLEKLS